MRVMERIYSPLHASVYSVLISSNKINCKKNNTIHRVTITYDTKETNIIMHQNVTICANMPISKTVCS